MNPIRITKVYSNLDDTSAAFVTFQFPSGQTTDILITVSEFRKIGAYAMAEGFQLIREQDKEGYIKKETIEFL